jgi:hypothetical protein
LFFYEIYIFRDIAVSHVPNFATLWRFREAFNAHRQEQERHHKKLGFLPLLCEAAGHVAAVHLYVDYARMTIFRHAAPTRDFLESRKTIRECGCRDRSDTGLCSIIVHCTPPMNHRSKTRINSRSRVSVTWRCGGANISMGDIRKT